MNFELFAEAVARLESLVVPFEKEPGDLMLRDAILHRFEVTYELALKVLRQRLKLDLGSSDVVDIARLKDDAFRRNVLRDRLPLPLEP